MPTRILIVDDHGDLRKLVRLTLDLGEYELHEAESGMRALELMDVVRPDVMILDVMMPGELNGIQVCEQIKSAEATRHIKVFLLSAKGQQTDIDVGLAAGADGYLVKPFSPLQLIETVDHAFRAAA